MIRQNGLEEFSGYEDKDHKWWDEKQKLVREYGYRRGVAMHVKLHACMWEVDVVIKEENGYWES